VRTNAAENQAAEPEFPPDEEELVDAAAGADEAPPDDEPPEDDSLDELPEDELPDDELSPDGEELLDDAGDELVDVPRLSLR